MKKQVVLYKRNNKFALYAIGTVAVLLLSIALIYNMATTGFSWGRLLGTSLMLSGCLYTGKGLYEYLTFKNVSLVVESDGEKLWFYNTTSKNKTFNHSQEYLLSKLQRFYIVKKHTRYAMEKYVFAFENKATVSRLAYHEADVFPSLFEARPEGHRQVLQFVKEVCPEIITG